MYKKQYNECMQKVVGALHTFEQGLEADKLEGRVGGWYGRQKNERKQVLDSKIKPALEQLNRVVKANYQYVQDLTKPNGSFAERTYHAQRAAGLLQVLSPEQLLVAYEQIATGSETRTNKNEYRDLFRARLMNHELEGDFERLVHKHRNGFELLQADLLEEHEAMEYHQKLFNSHLEQAIKRAYEEETFQESLRLNELHTDIRESINSVIKSDVATRQRNIEALKDKVFSGLNNGQELAELQGLNESDLPGQKATTEA